MGHNPLVDEVVSEIQTVSISLPSNGAFYTEDTVPNEVDVTDLQIKPISIMTELHLRDPFLLASGKAIPRLISQICPAILEPNNLCTIDIEAILIACRLVSHGKDYNVVVMCNNPEKDKDDKKKCSNEIPVQIDLQDFILRYSPIQDFSNYELILEKYNQHVFLRPMSYADSVELFKQSAKATKHYKNMVEMVSDEDEDITNTRLVNAYSSLIDEYMDMGIDTIVDSIHYVKAASGKIVMDKTFIKEWLLSVDRDSYNSIEGRIKSIAEDLKQVSMIHIDCPECGYKNEFNVDFDIQKLFFYEAQTSETPKKQSNTSRKSAATRKLQSRTSQR